MKDFLEKLVGIVPVLEPYPLWTKVLISVWVLLTAVIVVSLVFGRPPAKAEDKLRTPSNPSPPLDVPIASEVAKIVSAESLDILRRTNGVRTLRALENDLNLSRLPTGVYGFTVPWIINADSTGIVGGTGVNQITLQQSSGGTAVMEIHKGTNGEVYVVGYVSEADLVRLQDPSRRADVEATLFFTPYREFSLIVAIPTSRIRGSRNRSIGDKYVNDLLVH